MAKNPMTKDNFDVRPTYFFCQGAWHKCILLSLSSGGEGERIVLRYEEGPAQGKRIVTGDPGLVAKDKDGKRRYRSGAEIVA